MVILVLSFLAVAQPETRCVAPAGYEVRSIIGILQAGEGQRTAFGGEFFFVLEPNGYGWVIQVQQRGREENLASLTPPWHFVPNPRYVEGWHFRNESNTGPNDGSVNAPQETREFIFSPEVGRSLEYEGSATPAAVVEEVCAFGRGELRLTEYRLSPVAEGARASFVEAGLRSV